MNDRTKKALLITGGILAILYFTMQPWAPILDGFFKTWEGFKSTPYWDYKQWSWGYGTRVPGSSTNPSINPGGSITRVKAMADALQHVQTDYLYLKPMIKMPLNPRQWAALLSFSYNEGSGNADNLVKNINSGDMAALETQWKLYIYAGGEVNDDLIARRNAEWNLFIS